MPLSWISAFKRSMVYFLWLIVWSIVGILMMVIGLYVAAVPLAGLFSVPAKPLTPGTELITGLALFILGYLITMLGTIATFIRLLYQLSFEATQEAITKGKPAATSSIAMPMTEIKLTPTAMPSAAQPAPQQLEAPRQPMSPVSPPPQQKYCAFCGRPIAVSSKFCPFCQRAQP
jgi:hypothetical protein